MQDHWDPEAALAALAWQIEAGVTEAITDGPINRFLPEVEDGPKVEARSRAPQAKDASVTIQASDFDPLTDAARLATAASTLHDLREALMGFEGCSLRRGARTLVFADGDPSADLMIIGEAPGRDEDRAGQPFAGAQGALLDKMLIAIGLSRTAPGAKGAYLTHLSPWRPVRGQQISEQDMACLMPFLDRHVALQDPKIILLMGQGTWGLGASAPPRQRGSFSTLWGRPALAMASPEFLMRNPARKKEAWANLLALKGWLEKD